MQFFMSFYGGQLKQQICYSFTLLISYMVFNPFEMAAQLFLDFIKFSQFWWSKCFFLSQIQQAPGPDFRKVGKSLSCSHYLLCIWSFLICFTYKQLDVIY